MQGASPGVHEVFADALRHHQAGRLNEAERLHRQGLAVDSHHADSLHLLGVVANQMGRRDLANNMISQAIAINAKVAAYHSTETPRGEGAHAVGAHVAEGLRVRSRRWKLQVSDMWIIS